MKAEGKAERSLFYSRKEVTGISFSFFLIPIFNSH